MHVKGSERKPGQLLRGRERKGRLERKVEALIAMNREWSKGRHFIFFYLNYTKFDKKSKLAVLKHDKYVAYENIR